MRSLLLAASAAIALFAVACAEAPTDENPALPKAATPDCAQTPYATGCQTKKADGDKSVPVTPAVEDGKESADRACAAKTCEDFGGACGEHDDGCGSKFSCGDCAPKNPDCKKKTCDDLGAACGTHDDGCGGTVSCGTCATACATDAKEPNDVQGKATDLGKFADTEDKTIELKNLASADGDEDWFKMDVTDEGFGSNPTIEITSTDAKLEVSVFHQCKALPNYSYCYGPGKTEKNGATNDENGLGCINMGKTTVKTDCKGTNEAGTTYIRVRKNVSDMSCHSYDLKATVY
ncbi:MAG: hypothetical protein U0270_43025 [Labilithrix sp.]